LGCRTHACKLNRRPIPRNHEHAPATGGNFADEHSLKSCDGNRDTSTSASTRTALMRQNGSSINRI
jgi:hypothetical protein